MFNGVLKEKLESIQKNPKTIKIVVFCGIIIIALIYLFDFFTPKNDIKSDDQTTFQAEEYKTALEKQLTSNLQNISGVGKVKVMITLESNREVIYENQKEYDKSLDENGEKYSEKKNTVIVDSGNSDNGLIKRINEPEIRGVLVVCDGGGNASVKAKVSEAVEKLFKISSARVCVTN